MDTIGKVSLAELTMEDAESFLMEKQLSGVRPETYNHYHSAIKFLYRRLLKALWDDDAIPRMKNDRSLPTVLTKADVDKPTVQDIFLRFYPGYLERYRPSPQQAKTANNIINCKTGAYGANVSVCEDCGSIQMHYNSCRNRCCPMCQALPKEKWIDLRREDVLDVPYFHVVFTMPEELNPVIYSNQFLLYNAMYHAASDTLDELSADGKYLGAIYRGRLQ